MKIRTLILLAAVCAMPVACADGSLIDPPVYEQPEPPVVTTPETPEIPVETPEVPSDDDGPHYFPAETPHVTTPPTWEVQPAHPAQINPCLLHPEDC